MTQYLPPNLLALFAPRDPIQYMPPLDKLPHEKKLPPYQGVTACLQEFEDPKDTPPPTRVETKDEKRERKRKERQEQVAYQLEQDLALWDPSNDPSIAGDAFKTLFVGRINYDTSESKLRREFEVYGPIKRLKMVYNTHGGGKPRGYAFIEYEHERDMHSAYKHADGKKIDGRRVLVDVERGRTIKGWRPRRLAGGLGGTRKGGPDVNTKFSGREDGSSVQRDDRSRSRDRDRRRRSRSRDRRRGRSRSPRDRKPPRPRSRSRDRGRRDGEENVPFEGGVEVKIEGQRKRRRSRSRDRADRSDRRRSRSRERRRRSRSPRDRKRRRSRDRGRGDAGDMGENGMVRVKEEKGPVYPGEDENYGMANNYGPVPPQDGQPPPPPQDPYGNGGNEYGAPPPVPQPPQMNEYGSYQQN